ncbi:MAG TPA: hypothetical protein VND21_07510 [Planctomycetota bacterium]|nr:hypothetical protein [Planctomycetota bacterium]
MRRPILPVLAVLGGLLAGCDAGTKPGERPEGPRLFIAAPRMDQVLDAHDVEVVLDLRNYAIGRVHGKDGPHVHVIVDNEPYVAVYDVSAPVRLDPRLMTEGTHVVRAFPSAGPKDPAGALHHESRKNPGAYAWVRFHVKKKGGLLAEFDPKAPLLTYSRPKGEYKVGSPEHAKFMVDFHLANVKLGPGEYSVRATLDGTVVSTWDEEIRLGATQEKVARTEWATWKPWVLATPPAAGDHVLVLELIDREGKPVPGPFNRTERKFKVVP